MKKKIFSLIICLIVIINLCGCGKTKEKNGNSNSNQTSNEVEKLKELPLPEVTGGDRGKLGIDKNINELNIDEYLNRSDAVYRDMRMLEDPGNYEAIGGDRMLSGYVKSFEIVPLPYIVPVEGLPEEVGDTYKGTTLFIKDENGKYIKNYEESMTILEELFPKDKVIFLMCGGGGYAGQMKEVLISLGWNKDKIYNIGGYWYYEGKNNVQVKKVENGHTTYDFDNVPYHNIEFDKLKKIDNEPVIKPNTVKVPITLSKVPTKLYDEYNVLDTDDGVKSINRKAEIINELIDKKYSFVITVENNNDHCNAGGEWTVPLSAKALLQLSDLQVFSANLHIFKKFKYYKDIRYAPTVIVINKGKLYAYYDPNKDSTKEFDDKAVYNWTKQYVNNLKYEE